MIIKGIKSSPIKKNILANLFGVGVNLLNQIALVPLYIIFWGNALYADWIVLSAMTVIFSMSDVGLNTVIQNRFSIKLSQNNQDECDALLTNNIIIVSAIFALSLILIGIYLYFTDIVNSLGLHTIPRQEAGIILILIIVRIYLGMYSGIENAIYRATHHNSRCVYIDQTAVMSNVIITIICLVLHINIVTMCIILCLPPIIVIILKTQDSKKYYIFRFSIKKIDWGLLKTMFKPAIAFLSFPIGNAFLLQGFTFVVNKYYGADEVVSYTTTRTMCNFIIVLLGTIQASVWPEYSIAYGKGDFERMRSLHSKAATLTLTGALLSAVVILVFGPYIYQIWTQGEVPFSYPLMSLFLLIIISKMFWSASGVTLLATNNHRIMGHIYIIGTGMSFAGAWIGASVGQTAVGITIYMLLTHLLMDSYTLKAGLKLTQDSLKNFYVRNTRFILRKNCK